MGKSKGELHGKCGAGVLYFTNGLLMTIGILVIIYGTLVHFRAFAKLNTPKLAATFPDFLIYGLIIFGCAIVLFSGVGIFGTVCMRKAADIMYTYDSENENKNDKKKKADAPCCATCTLALYIILTFVTFIILLVAGGIATSYQTGILNQEVTSLKAKYADSILDAWDRALTTTIEREVNTTEWENAQNVGGCCGWQYGNETVTAINKASTCCADNVRLSGNESLIDSLSCSVDKAVSPVGVRSCDSYIFQLVADNLIAIIATLFALAFISLTCFICAIVVRFAIHKEIKKSKSIQMSPTDKTEKLNP